MKGPSPTEIGVLSNIPYLDKKEQEIIYGKDTIYLDYGRKWMISRARGKYHLNRIYHLADVGQFMDGRVVTVCGMHTQHKIYNTVLVNYVIDEKKCSRCKAVEFEGTGEGTC